MPARVDPASSRRRRWRSHPLRFIRLRQESACRHRTSFPHISTGHSPAFGGRSRALEPGRTLVHTDAFDDAGLPGERAVTMTLETVSCSTDMRIEQAGAPDSVPGESCYSGWRQSLHPLALRVQAGGPDGD